MKADDGDVSVEQIRHLFYTLSFLLFSLLRSLHSSTAATTKEPDTDTLSSPFPSSLSNEPISFPEDEILEQVSSLRAKLLAALPSSGPRDPKTLKQSDTHSIAQAKELELTRMRGAFGLSSNYREGASFDREEQERLRVLKRAEYEEKDRVRAERMAAMEKAEEERKEVEKKRRRDEERA